MGGPELLQLCFCLFVWGWVFHLDGGFEGAVVGGWVVGGEGDVVGWVVVLGCYSDGEAGEGEEGVDYWDYGTAFVDGEGAVLEIVSSCGGCYW